MVSTFICWRVEYSILSLVGKGLGIKLLFARQLSYLIIIYFYFVPSLCLQPLCCVLQVRRGFFSSRRTENINQNLTLHLLISITLPHTSLHEKLLFCIFSEVASCTHVSLWSITFFIIPLAIALSIALSAVWVPHMFQVFQSASTFGLVTLRVLGTLASSKSNCFELINECRVGIFNSTCSR